MPNDVGAWSLILRAGMKVIPSRGDRYRDSYGAAIFARRFPRRRAALLHADLHARSDASIAHPARHESFAVADEVKLSEPLVPSKNLIPVSWQGFGVNCGEAA